MSHTCNIQVNNCYYLDEIKQGIEDPEEKDTRFCFLYDRIEPDEDGYCPPKSIMEDIDDIVTNASGFFSTRFLRL